MAKLRKGNNYGSRSSSIQITLSRKEEKSYKGKSTESRKKEWTVTCGVRLSIPVMFIK
jgi:hypothetical protein